MRADSASLRDRPKRERRTRTALALNLHLATCHSHSHCLNGRRRAAAAAGSGSLDATRARAEECEIPAEIVRRKFSRSRYRKSDFDWENSGKGARATAYLQSITCVDDSSQLLEQIIFPTLCRDGRYWIFFLPQRIVRCQRSYTKPS